MSQICPHCGSKYTTEIGIAQNTKRLAHEYRCDSCKKRFQVETDAQSASGEWMMTFWGYCAKDFVSVFKAPNGSIQINQSYEDSQTNKVSYHSGEITPRIYVESNLTGPYATGNYYLNITTKQGVMDLNGASMWIKRIEMNPELAQKAQENEAMKSAKNRYSRENQFDQLASPNKMLVNDRRDFIQSLLGEPSNPGVGSSFGSCYIATAVYGSYDCPQVWTLRRFRDNTLAATWYGRAFIRTYYAISPMLVKWFGHTRWFKKLWKGRLDHMVKRLNASGVDNAPYEDRKW